jgi:hypothetical protein
VGFMENKTRKYGWLGETSNKRRVMIAIDKVPAWMRGEWVLNHETDPKADEDGIALAAEMQSYFVKVRGLFLWLVVLSLR